MYESRAYDDHHGDPVVVLVTTGTHDVSRLVHLLDRGLVEHVRLAKHVLRQVRRHNGGRAALQLLAAHGGPDLLHGVPAAADERERVILGALIDRRVELEGPDFDRGDENLAGYARAVRAALAAHDPGTAHMKWIAEQYRQCIVAARVAGSSYQYDTNNGRAEAYRQAAVHLAPLLGVEPPDWDAIRQDVPADGIYRAPAAGELGEAIAS